MRVGGILLAAGQSSRIAGGHHKLLAEFDGAPLVRKSAETMLRSGLSSVVVVTGHRSSEIEQVIGDLPLSIVFNEDFLSGMGTSLSCGFRHESLGSCAGALIMLADMPAITEEHIDRLIAAFRALEGRQLVRGASGDQAGHPVVIPAHLFERMTQLKGDEGAKAILQNAGVEIRLVDLGPAALSDVDTVDAIRSAGGSLTT
ncbi:nucleotidyltransferase family protein [Agrobacterium sp. SORGH_AS 787]|uniref:nucleotidyltransferase family protein n=1 Tax=Agrobacterium sp. SORGH_AS 787 TaxID=3041775 RepID=UPI002780DA2A|nr:molybdenum cofactor cytidylyltransferase [Rhizobium sp. SORGH_AS_0787]